MTLFYVKIPLLHSRETNLRRKDDLDNFLVTHFSHHPVRLTMAGLRFASYHFISAHDKSLTDSLGSLHLQKLIIFK